MTVVNIFNETREDLLLQQNFMINLMGKNFKEVERKKKIVRCYICGHISATCTLHEICENCKEGLSATSSTNNPRLFNCGGYHKTSSNQCQTDLTKLQEIQIQQMCLNIW